MPKCVELHPDQIEWLTSNHDKTTLTNQANQIGCCVDTLKRILVRLGLREFEAAKYQLNRKSEEKLWSRPCMKCKSEETRPKNWYFCRPCRANMGYEEV